MKDGITLISLTITIIVLTILSTVLLLSFGDEDVIESTQESIEKYKTDREDTAEKVDTMVSELDNAGRINTTQIESVKKVIKDGPLSELEVAYTPSTIEDGNGNPAEVVVRGSYNGGISNQSFNQTNIGAIGNNKVKWYVLSIDDKGVNLVSEPTKASVSFKDSAGYDNCLYYLNEISTKLFTNVDTYGVNESRVHALRFSDIKYAAEQVNEGSLVSGTSRKWTWDYEFIKNAPTESSGSKTYNSGNVGKNLITTSAKYFPKLYRPDSSNDLTINNSLYDEIPNKLVADDGGIMRNESGNPANSLSAYYTYVGYYNNRASMITRLGNFGSSALAGELFNASGTSYYLASRCLRVNDSYTYYHLRAIRESGELDTATFCLSNGTVYEQNRAFRVVVSIPQEHINISSTGKVTLK